MLVGLKRDIHTLKRPKLISVHVNWLNSAIKTKNLLSHNLRSTYDRCVDHLRFLQWYHIADISSKCLGEVMFL